MTAIRGPLDARNLRLAGREIERARIAVERAATFNARLPESRQRDAYSAALTAAAAALNPISPARARADRNTAIRDAYRAGQSYAAIARAFRLSPSQVGRIIAPRASSE